MAWHRSAALMRPRLRGIERLAALARRLRLAAVALGQRLGAPLPGRLAFLAFLAALLGYGGFYAGATLASFDVVNLHRDAFIDDAFYYFEIARNLAAGKFSTFDGGITRTNGYHPVWLLLVTPFYWVFDLESALFGIRALELMLIAGGVCLMAVALRLARLPWFLLFAALPALYVQTGMTMGMEAAAGAFFLGATLLVAVLFAQDARRWRWLLAGIAFLLPWVRLEYVVVALFVTGGLGLVLRFGAPRTSPTATSRLPVAGLPFVAAVAGILAYLSYNGLVFGGVLPVSAAAKLADGPGDTGADWGAIGDQLLATAAPHAMTVAEFCCYALAVWSIARWRGRNQEAAGLLAVLATALALAVENLVAQALVASFFAPGMAQWAVWYWVPGYLVAALVVPVRCCVAVFLLRRFLPVGWANWRRLAVVAVCAAGLAEAYDPHQFTEPFRRVAEQSHSLRLAGTWPLAGEIAAFEPLLPDDAVVGAFDSGAMGYFAETPVVNLDGLVNSYDYLRRDPDKTSLWLHGAGVPELKVTHLVNVTPHRRIRHIAEVDYVGRFEGPATLTLLAQGKARSARPWQSATSPGFGADGEPNGYRVIRHGRLLQVFVPNCILRETATNVPEMLKFTWREGAQAVSEWRLWLQPRRARRLGYCTTSFLLPHGARAAAEIFVDATTVARVVADAAPIVRTRPETPHAPAETSGYAYTVYVVQGRLLWIREPREAGRLGQPGDACYRRGPLGGAYFLHVRPAARRHVPYERLEHGFVNDDRALRGNRRRAGSRCLAEVELPAVPIREIVTGDVVDGKPIWSARIDGLALQPGGVDEFLAASARVLSTDGWDVYHHEDERKLLFVREGHGNAPGSEALAGCAAGQVFVHVHPRRVEDLPAWHRQHGFSNHDFDYGETGFVAGGRCLHAVALPDWDVSHVVAGAYGGSPHTWHVE